MGDFLICSFPRSRTLWLANFLSITGKSVVTHEACEFAGSAQEFWENADSLHPDGFHYGNADSASIFVLPALLAERPMTRVVWINRSIVEVCKSMQSIGMPMEEKSARLMLDLRDRYCEHFDLVIDFHSLSQEHIISILWNYCLPGVPFNLVRFRQYNVRRICYTKDNPMPKKDTKRFTAWVNRELSQPVEH